MKWLIAATGASGSIYLQRLLDRLAPLVAPPGLTPPTSSTEHEIHLVLSEPAEAVITGELGRLRIPPGVRVHDNRDMNAPFVSGSARFDAMAIVPCSMGTLGRIAAGVSDSVILRAADVFLKERRKLILVPRETPWSLIHARNAVAVLEAGAVLMPACPGFYSRPETVEAVVDTVVERILDHLGVGDPEAFRWGEV